MTTALKFGTSKFYVQGLLPTDRIRVTEAISVYQFFIESDAELTLTVSVPCRVNCIDAKGGLSVRPRDERQLAADTDVLSPGVYFVKPNGHKFSFDVREVSESVPENIPGIVPGAPPYTIPINRILDGVTADRLSSDNFDDDIAWLPPDAQDALLALRKRSIINKVEIGRIRA